MKQPGRKSAASLALADRVMGAMETIQRPDVPYDLDDEEATEWRAVVDRMPATWFGRETHALLTQYCRHTVRARRIAQLIRAAENPPKQKRGEDAPEFDVAAYNTLLIMQDRESRAIATLSMKMRIAQQSCISQTDKKARVGKRPWQPE